MTIPVISIPIAWTVICVLAFLLWPRKRATGDYGIDIMPMFLAFIAIIAALVGWIVYLVLKEAVR